MVPTFSLSRNSQGFPSMSAIFPDLSLGPKTKIELIFKKYMTTEATICTLAR